MHTESDTCNSYDTPSIDYDTSPSFSSLLERFKNTL